MNRQQLPSLKNGVDLQLQSAFGDGNWSVVIRLAENRTRTLKDPYYEIVKVCAESQLDDPVAKFAAVSAIDKYVRDGTVLKDVDGIDLLEWAAQGLAHEDDFGESLGPLRVRLVKAAPKDKVAATRCLESCLLHWDLNSAQQIAAILDRSFPQERPFLFWNLVITHLLAMSPQSAPEKKKLYGMLALKQIQRAAQLAEQALEQGDNAAATQPRSVQTEEEMSLLYDVTEKHGSKEDFTKLLASPLFSPLKQFQKGHKELFLRVATKYETEANWEALYRLSKDCLSSTNEDGSPNMLASDWIVWRRFIDAAVQVKSVDSEVEKTVQDLLLKFIKAADDIPIYKRNVLLARLITTFNLVSHEGEDLTNGEPVSLRLKELMRYIESQGTSLACFDDVKASVEKLTPAAMKYLAYEYVPKLAQKAEGELDAAWMRTLSLKLQYFIATNPAMYTTIPSEKPMKKKCIVTEKEVEATSPGPAFATIILSALELYQSLAKAASTHSAVEAEIKPELATVIALSNIQIAFPPSTDNTQQPISLAPLLRALLILEHQLSLTPKHGIMSLLLVQLHMRLGSIQRAREIWETLGVKRTIMDSLAPIFYDRLSTISPAAISPSDENGWELMDLLHSHYQVSLKLRMTRRLIDAFEACNYGSVLQIPRYIEALRYSCVRAMGLVEQTRTERMLGERFSEVMVDPRFTEVTNDTELVSVLDYGSFPLWDCSSRPPVYARLRVGPAPTNRRSHLSLLAEAFHEALGYKAPAIYKASAAAAATDQIFLLETLARLGNSFTQFLNGPASDLTAQEAVYFEVISLLCTLVTLSTAIDRSAPLPEEFTTISDAVKAGLEALSMETAAKGGPEPANQVNALSSMHTLAMLRDTAGAAKGAAQWILAFNEREKERDRSGKSNLPKEVVALVKAMQTAAEAALGEGKDRVWKLKEQVYWRDFEPRVKRWIFEGTEGEKEVAGDAPVKALLKSWESNAKGWKVVAWS